MKRYVAKQSHIDTTISCGLLAISIDGPSQFNMVTKQFFFYGSDNYTSPSCLL